MKVYFTGSISGRDKYLKNYQAIVDDLRNRGIEVFEDTISPTKEYIYEEITDQDKIKYYQTVLKWMNQVDVVIAEASTSSLSIGHEISLALEKNKPVVVLYAEGKAPHFLVGVQSEKLQLIKYDLNNLQKVLDEALEYAIAQQDTRFNFFVSPKIVSYLDWVAKNKRLPRAVYLRKLIEDEMRKDKEYVK